MKCEREREKGRERARSLVSSLVCQYHKISDTCHCIEVFERDYSLVSLDSVQKRVSENAIRLEL